MTWARQPVAEALAEAFAAAAPLVSCFEKPPATLNPPALVCTDPQSVLKRTAGMGVDRAEFIVTAIVGLEQADELDALLDTADQAIFADPTLGGVCYVATTTEYRSYRQLNIGGADYRAADIAITIDR